MLNIINILKGRTKKVVVHGPKKGDRVSIDLSNSSSVDVKAFAYLINTLYSKNKRNYKLSPTEEIELYKDIKNSGIISENVMLADLSDYKVYLFNNRHKIIV